MDINLCNTWVVSTLGLLTNNTTMNIHLQVFVRTYVFNSPEYIPRSGISGSEV